MMRKRIARKGIKEIMLGSVCFHGKKSSVLYLGKDLRSKVAHKPNPASIVTSSQLGKPNYLITGAFSVVHLSSQDPSSDDAPNPRRDRPLPRRTDTTPKSQDPCGGARSPRTKEQKADLFPVAVNRTGIRFPLRLLTGRSWSTIHQQLVAETSLSTRAGNPLSAFGSACS